MSVNYQQSHLHDKARPALWLQNFHKAWTILTDALRKGGNVIKWEPGSLRIKCGKCWKNIKNTRTATTWSVSPGKSLRGCRGFCLSCAKLLLLQTLRTLAAENTGICRKTTLTSKQKIPLTSPSLFIFLLQRSLYSGWLRSFPLYMIIMF